jgi:DNA-binding NtrC family response regulator/ligand-binding sensor domain-containing protein
MTSSRLLLLVTSLLLPAVPMRAHNGAVAIAVPMSDIRVDGDLSDWPRDLAIHPTARTEYGVPPSSTTDLQASFRVGRSHDNTELYLAIDVTDDSWIGDETGRAGWDGRDGVEIYLDLQHAADSRTLQYVMRGGEWGLGLAEGIGSIVPAANVDAAMAQSPGRRRYEWRLALPETVTMPSTLSFDVVVCDLDADSSFSWIAWGPGRVKALEPGRRGDLVLSSDGTGRLRGTVKWGDPADGSARGVVVVEGDTHPAVNTRLRTEADGQYDVALPVGTYRLRAGYGRHWSKSVEATVAADRPVWAPEVSFARPPLGVVTVAGSGRRLPAGSGVKEGQWHTLGASDGLPDAAVTDMVQDREGFLWFATDGGGVARFDGTNFLRLTEDDGLASNRVMAVATDDEGRLWFGTWGGGLSRYDGQSFVTYTEQDGLVSNWLWDVLVDRSKAVWVASEGDGVSRWHGDRFTTFLQDQDQISSIVADGEGRLWFAGPTGAVSHWDGSAIARSEAGQFPDILSGAAAADGIWFGDSDGQAARYTDGHFEVLSLETMHPRRAVESIAVDEEANVWFSTHGEGVRRWDGQRLSVFGVADGLASQRVTAILVDREGILWFGTADAGVTRYDGGGFTPMGGSPDIARARTVLEARDGALWIGTAGSGLLRRQHGVETIYTVADGLIFDDIWRVMEDTEDRLWVATPAGISCWDGASFRSWGPEDGAPHVPVTRLIEDKGSIWLGTDGAGISRWDGERFESFTTDEGLPGNRVFALLVDRHGDLWVGTHGGGGLARYDGHSFLRYTTADGLPDNNIMDLVEDGRGDLWVATFAGGLARYDGQRFHRVDDAHDPGHRRTRALAPTPSGRLWIGTAGGGVSQYDGEVFQSLLRRDGLASNTVWEITPTRSGAIWIVTDEGAQQYRPRDTPPMLQMTGIVADRRHVGNEQVVVSTLQELVSFEFNGVSFRTRPGEMVYRYRLDGYDPEWYQTRDTQVEYVGLPAGDYLFSVQAINQDLVRSKTVDARLSVRPPYMRWALGSVSVFGLVTLTLGAIASIRRRREQDRARLRLEEAQRMRVAEEAVRARLEAENVYLQDEIKLVHNFERIITQSDKLRQVLRSVEQVAETDATVLLLGESGTGKELVARALHSIGSRRGRPLVKVNCAALPASLIESELFGHEKGAFTGAHARKAGRFELAHGGTLFLDEIGEIPLAMQPKLLRALQEGEVERLGGTATIEVDVRLIAATNRDLEQSARDGTFREDLYFRLNVFPVRIPPLRERVDDIPLLVSHFVKIFSAKLGKDIHSVPQQTMDRLRAYSWPGNVRELENVVERAAIISPGPELQIGDWLPGVAGAATEGEICTLDEGERRLIRKALAVTGGRVSGDRGAANLLGINPKTLASRMKRLGIGRQD